MFLANKLSHTPYNRCAKAGSLLTSVMAIRRERRSKSRDALIGSIRFIFNGLWWKVRTNLRATEMIALPLSILRLLPWQPPAPWES
jgi:hypothetical protein